MNVNILKSTAEKQIRCAKIICSLLTPTSCISCNSFATFEKYHLITEKMLTVCPEYTHTQVKEKARLFTRSQMTEYARASETVPCITASFHEEGRLQPGNFCRQRTAPRVTNEIKYLPHLHHSPSVWSGSQVTRSRHYQLMGV